MSLLSIPSMYGIFAYIWLNFMVNVGKYTIYGWSGFFTLHTTVNIPMKLGHMLSQSYSKLLVPFRL